MTPLTRLERCPQCNTRFPVNHRPEQPCHVCEWRPGDAEKPLAL